MATIDELRASECGCWRGSPGESCAVCRDDDARDDAAYIRGWEDARRRILSLIKGPPQLVCVRDGIAAMQAPKMSAFQTRIARLDQALRDIIEAECCGCSVYAEIAEAALDEDQEGPRRRSMTGIEVPTPTALDP